MTFLGLTPREQSDISSDLSKAVPPVWSRLSASLLWEQAPQAILVHTQVSILDHVGHLIQLLDCVRGVQRQ